MSTTVDSIYYKLGTMRKFTQGAAMALALAASTLLISAPAHADTSTIEYTVTNDDPVIHAWSDGRNCSDSSKWWQGSARNAVMATATASATGTYTFRDKLSPGDGRIMIFKGAYNPSDVSNCIIEIEDYGEADLEAGVTYTLLLAGFGATTGSFVYQTDGLSTIAVTPVPVPTVSTVHPSASLISATDTFDLVGAVSAPGFTADFAGSMEFFSDEASLGSAPVDATGAATLSGASLPAGSPQITAQYSGNAKVAASLSAPAPVEVTPVESTVALEVASGTAAFVIDLITLEAQISAPGISTGYEGTVEFFDGTTSLGIAAVEDDGAAEYGGFRLAAGRHELTAQYSGDARVTAATSAVVALDVAALGSITSVSASPVEFEVGGNTTLTAIVEGTGPTGTVEFFVGDRSIGSVDLEEDQSMYPTTALATTEVTAIPIGKHVITARYSGDAINLASVSDGLLVVTVQEAPAPKPAPKPTPDTPTAKPKSQLAATGGPSTAPMLGVGAVVLLLGSAAMLVVRRRTRV